VGLSGGDEIRLGVTSALLAVRARHAVIASGNESPAPTASGVAYDVK
jgi:hypothetical protein